MTEPQAIEAYLFIEKVREHGLYTVKLLEDAVKKSKEIKTALNSNKFQIMGMVGPDAGRYNVPLPVTNEGTAANGLCYSGISGTHYEPAQAAVFLGIDEFDIIQALQAGTLLEITIYGKRLIPEKALTIYKKSKSS